MNTHALKRKKKLKYGLAPGSLVFTGTAKMPHVTITAIHYSEDRLTIDNIPDIATAVQQIDSHQGCSWINIDGLHDITIIEHMCAHLGVHRLTMEDILSVNQRPKIEVYPEYLYIVLKMLTFDQTGREIDTEQISIILKENTLVTFQEKTGDVFEDIRKRIRDSKSRIRKMKSDYLLYALIDSIIDYYFVILEHIGEKIEDIETALSDNPDKEILNHLHLIRKEMAGIRRSVYPVREVVGRLEKLGESFITQDVALYVRDLYDHAIRAIENIDTSRETASGLLDQYMNIVSNKMNDVMKVLTIIATIFIPLTFIAGIYGMNFENMPELHWKYSYFATLGVMGALFAVMIIIFRRKKWI